MNVSYLQFDRMTGGQWGALLPFEENMKYNFVANLDAFKPVPQGEEPITMILVNPEEKENRYKNNDNHFDNEILPWRDDMLFGASRSVVASKLIVSKKLKEIITQFKLPPHSIHRLEIINNDDQTDRKEYFMIHIYDRLIDHADYAKSEFKEYSTRTKEIFDIKYNVFKDVDDYFYNQTIDRENRIYLEFNKFVLKDDYDVVWSAGANLLISDPLKSAILAANLKKGLEIVPFTKYQIIGKSEYDTYGLETPHPIS